MVDRLPSLLIRIGIAFAFTYAAISMSLDPSSYTYYLPSFVTTFLPASTMLHIFGGFEIILSLWLLSGKILLFSSSLALITIFCLTIVNLDSFNVLFRNVSIFFSGLALIVMSLKNNEKKYA